MESGVTSDFFNKFKNYVKSVDKEISLRYNNLCKQKEVGKTYWFTRSIVERRWWYAISRIKTTN